MRESFYSKTGRRRVLLLVAVLLTAALSALYLWYPPFVASLNNRVTDAVMALAPDRPVSGSVVIVDIDEKSLADYGQWPWPRSLLAQLLRRIAASGAATIGLDLILAEPDRTSLNNASTDNDRDLADVLAQGPYVLGYAFTFRGPKMHRSSTLHHPGIVWFDMPETAVDRVPLFTAKSVICNLPSFSNAVRRLGFLNATPDDDGILRRVPMLIRFEDGIYPSFALAMLMQYGKIDQVEIVRRKVSDSLDLWIGNRAVPIDRHGNLRVRFSRAADTPRVSASEILKGGQADKQFRNKIVLVGASAAGLEPTYTIAQGTLHNPAEIHAHVLENLLAGQRVVRTRKFLLWEVLVAIAVAAVTVLAVAAIGVLPSAVLCAAMTAGAWLGAGALFRGSDYLPALDTTGTPGGDRRDDQQHCPSVAPAVKHPGFDRAGPALDLRSPGIQQGILGRQCRESDEADTAHVADHRRFQELLQAGQREDIFHGKPGGGQHLSPGQAEPGQH
jgi:adenylate cyclase